MTINLIKISVGIEDIEHLKRKQKQFISNALNHGAVPEIIHYTRNTPRRSDEMLQGGSIYWVIKRFIRARQLIREIRRINGPKGKKSCAIILEPEIIKTELKQFRVFQGWRYLSLNDAPSDLSVSSISSDDIPEDLVNDLKELGLL